MKICGFFLRNMIYFIHKVLLIFTKKKPSKFTIKDCLILSTSKGVCACVCVVLWACVYSALPKRRLRKPEETGSHLSSSLSVTLSIPLAQWSPSQSLSDSESPCSSPTASVSWGEGTNDGSVSAQSAVTETTLNLSLPLPHPIHPSIPSPCLLSLLPFSSSCIFPPFSSLSSISITSLFGLTLPVVPMLCHVPSSPPQSPSIPSLYVCLWGDDCIRLVWLRTPASRFPHFTG